MNTFLAFLWECTLSVALVGSILLFIRFVFGRLLGPKLRYYLWIILLLHMLAVPLPASSFSLFSVFSDADHSLSFISSEQAPINPSTKSNVPSQFPEKPSFSQVDAPTDDTVTYPSVKFVEKKSFSFPIAPILFSLYFMGVFILLLRKTVSFFRFKRKLATLSPCKDPESIAIFSSVCKELSLPPLRFRLLIGSQTSLVGLFHPVIILSEEFSKEETYAALLHELIHYKSKDLWFAALFELACVFHFFNPIIWVANFCFRSDCEYACDAQVLTHAVSRRTYAETLLRAVDSPSFFPFATSFGSSQKQTTRRVRQVAAFRKRGLWLTLSAVILLSATILITLTSARTKPLPKEIPITDPQILNDFYSAHVYDAIPTVMNFPFEKGKSPHRQSAIDYTIFTLLREKNSSEATSFSISEVERKFTALFGQKETISSKDFESTAFYNQETGMFSPRSTSPNFSQELSSWGSRLISLTYCEELSRYTATIGFYSDAQSDTPTRLDTLIFIAREEGNFLLESITRQIIDQAAPVALSGKYQELSRINFGPDALLPGSVLYTDDHFTFFTARSANGVPSLQIVHTSDFNPFSSISLSADATIVHKISDGYLVVTTDGVEFFDLSFKPVRSISKADLFSQTKFTADRFDVWVEKAADNPTLLFADHTRLYLCDVVTGNIRTLHESKKPLYHARFTYNGQIAFCEESGYDYPVSAILARTESGASITFPYDDQAKSDSHQLQGPFHASRDAKKYYSLYSVDAGVAVLETLHAADLTSTKNQLALPSGIASVLQDASGMVGVQGERYVAAIGIDAENKYAILLCDTKTNTLEVLATFSDILPTPISVTEQGDVIFSFHLDQQMMLAKTAK